VDHKPRDLGYVLRGFVRDLRELFCRHKQKSCGRERAVGFHGTQRKQTVVRNGIYASYNDDQRARDHADGIASAGRPDDHAAGIRNASPDHTGRSFRSIGANGAS
jgi:hypothetical protein